MQGEPSEAAMRAAERMLPLFRNCELETADARAMLARIIDEEMGKDREEQP